MLHCVIWDNNNSNVTGVLTNAKHISGEPSPAPSTYMHSKSTPTLQLTRCSIDVQVKPYLADFGIDMEVYAFWCWRYYPDWIAWYRSQPPQPDQAGQDPTTTSDAAATAVDSVQEGMQPSGVVTEGVTWVLSSVCVTVSRILCSQCSHH